MKFYLIPLFIAFSFTILTAQDCSLSTSLTRLSANNVVTPLQVTGGLWWDGEDGQYQVLDGLPLEETPSALFAGGVWMGGFDPARNLKLAASTYGFAQGRGDFFPGPLDATTGTTDAGTCANWDRFFEVTKDEIEAHWKLLEQNRQGQITYTADMIPENVAGWAAVGNPHFQSVNGFELPNTPQGLADFWDENADGIYNPLEGDYPIVTQRDCDLPVVPDQMIFWIFNDAGNPHTQTNADPMQMEFQVTAFGFDRGDDFGNATFYKYKLINRAFESLEDAYFGLWTDPDLGCYTDDYIGCDTTRNLWFLYNEDATDGDIGCDCPQGVLSYCEEIPMVGMDIFRGPLNANGDELGMSSFTYYSRNQNPIQTDPVIGIEYYSYLTGRWRDGSPFPTNGYAFPDSPNCIDPGCFSMCQANLPSGDRRVVQSVGPMSFAPGAVNELILGVIYTPDVPHPCPDLNQLQRVDDIIQANFNNCLQLQEVPDAPHANWTVDDQSLSANISNNPESNNFEEGFFTVDIAAPNNLPLNDRAYQFEGYKVFQLKSAFANAGILKNPDLAQLVYQTDIQNGIGEIENWIADMSATPPWVAQPQVLAPNPDSGLELTFELTEDAFTGDDLENEKTYHYAILAYAHNSWQTFDPITEIGQTTPYLQGDISVFSVTPTNRLVPPNPGNGTAESIIRIDGVGAGSRFLDMCDGMHDDILNATFDGTICYQGDKAPFEIRVLDADKFTDRFEVTFIDQNMDDDLLDGEIQWQLTNLDDPTQVFTSDPFDDYSYAEFPDDGFAIYIVLGLETGNNSDRMGDPANGAIGFETEYADPDGAQWYSAKADQGSREYNFISDGGLMGSIDPTNALSRMGDGWWVPYLLCEFDVTRPIPFISPVWRQQGALVRQRLTQVGGLGKLNNVDVVLTPDKSKWSRSMVIESTAPSLSEFGFQTEGNAEHFALRSAPSVGKEDVDGDGLADPDGDGMGMGWFPGYAIDVETGKRLNIFFGEASIYRCDEPFFKDFLRACDQGNFNPLPTGGDMIWNPTNQEKIFNAPAGTEGIWEYMTGGMHFIYLTDQEYDECAEMRTQFENLASPFSRIRALENLTWTTMPIFQEGQELLSYADGLIPNELTMKIRVDNPFQVEEGRGDKNGYPTYLFSLDGVVSTNAPFAERLNQIRLSPNPFESSMGALRVENLPLYSNLRVFDLNGTPIFSKEKIQSTRWEWKPPAELSAGVYFIEAQNEKHGRTVKKWVYLK